MREGKFREDLFYRLKVVSISLPPLRDRKEDIPELAGYFLLRYNHEFGKKIKKIDDAAIRAFCEYQWPGNIRQFESVIEKAVLMCESDIITLDDIRGELQISSSASSLDIPLPGEGLRLEELETSILIKAMEMSNNVVARAAKLVGMNYYAFYNRWDKIQQGSSGKHTPAFDMKIPESGISLEKIEEDLLRKAMAMSNNVISKAARLLGISYKSFYNKWEKINPEAKAYRREESL